jgi:hypothetical protein
MLAELIVLSHWVQRAKPSFAVEIFFFHRDDPILELSAIMAAPWERGSKKYRSFC